MEAIEVVATGLIMVGFGYGVLYVVDWFVRAYDDWRQAIAFRNAGTVEEILA